MQESLLGCPVIFEKLLNNPQPVKGCAVFQIVIKSSMLMEIKPVFIPTTDGDNITADINGYRELTYFSW
jgi:hypothetical protein